MRLNKIPKIGDYLKFYYTHKKDEFVIVKIIGSEPDNSFIMKRIYTNVYVWKYCIGEIIEEEYPFTQFDSTISIELINEDDVIMEML